MKLLLAVACIAFSIATDATAATLSGLWDGTVRFGTVTVSFPIEFSGDDQQLTASLFNGEERVNSTDGALVGGELLLNFGHYATHLRGTVSKGVVTGTYGNDALMGQHEVELRPHRDIKPAAGKAPRIAGLWILPYESSKGEHAFRFIARQHAGQVSAAILRVDGDTGLLTGHYEAGRFVLNHFDGGRAYVLEIVPQRDDRLELTLRDGSTEKKFIATRADQASRQGLPQPSAFTSHTAMKDPDEPLRFSFPDLDGHIVANDDPRFAGKVLILNITGSWCPNCHDEAPFLAQLHRRYRALGMEVVALDFEEAGEPRNLTRLRAFIKTYGIEYQYLLAGATDELADKIPQARNLNAWPTTFFLGRDGKVRIIHAGFASPASGEFHAQVKREFTATVERLLAE